MHDLTGISLTDTPPSLHVIYAHPYPSKSVSTRALLDVLRRWSGTTVHSLYDRYPDMDIDVAAEQLALLKASHIVWLAPVYWYSVPALMKLWFDTVLAYGWAYGHEGNALHGKQCLWVANTGSSTAAYQAEGSHGRPFVDFVAPIESTARFCGMHWQPPFILHGGQTLGEAEMLAAQAMLAQQVEQMLAMSATASVRDFT